MAASYRRRYFPPRDRVAAALSAALWESVFWVFLPYLAATLLPGVEARGVVVLGALVALCAGVEALLPGHVVGAAFGLLGSALKVFVILGVTGWGRVRFEGEGYVVYLDARLIDAMLTVPIVVSLVDKLLTVGLRGPRG